jgi:hypothetical protein
MNIVIPIWLEPIDLAGWPTHVVESEALHYALPLRQGWNTVPHRNETPVEKEHVYRGLYPADCLAISFMEQADPAANVRNWVEALLRLAGFPIQALRRPDQAPPELLQWQYEGTSLSLDQRLAVDETHLYQGLAMLAGTPPDLARIYVLLARRGTWAWKVSLSFLSACPPGMPEEMITGNDHVRAGASLGYLRLLG